MPALADLHLASNSKREAISSSLTYLDSNPLYDTEKPYFISGDIPASVSRTNLTYTPKFPIPFYDVRHYKGQLSLHEHGFEYLHWSYPKPQSWNREAVNIFLGGMLEQLKAWLPDGPGEKLICYDYRFRHNGTAARDYAQDVQSTKPKQGPSNVPSDAILPINIPHADQTPTGGLRRAARHLAPQERELYLNTRDYRIQIFNTWTPINDQILDAPLAMCDRNTIVQSDLVPADRLIVGVEYVGEVYYVKYNPKHEWYWLRGQKREESVVYMSYDSERNDGKFCTVHASFVDPSVPDETPPRESLEARFIYITKK